MGKSSDAPAAPDPYVVAGAQTKQNQQTAAYNAALNRVNTSSPLGSQTFSVSGTDPRTGAPIYSQNISLAPGQQQLFDQQTAQGVQAGNVSGGLLNQIQGQYSNPVSTAGLPGLQGGVNQANLPSLPGQNDLNSYRQQTQDALYNRNTQYLDPQFSRSQGQLESKLANQGVVQGSEAYKNAMSAFNENKDQAYQGARDSAIAGGSQDMSNMFNIGSQTRSQLYGEGLANNQADNTARGQGLQELFSMREQPLQEYNALRSGSNAQLPQFSGMNSASANPADITGAFNQQYQGQLAGYNSNVATQNSNTAAGASLASAALMAFLLA